MILVLDKSLHSSRKMFTLRVTEQRVKLKMVYQCFYLSSYCLDYYFKKFTTISYKFPMLVKYSS